MFPNPDPPRPDPEPVPSPHPPIPTPAPPTPNPDVPFPGPEPEPPDSGLEGPATPPFWTYLDLAFILSLCIPALLVAALVARGIAALKPMGKPIQGLLAQLIWYVLVFTALYLLLRVRYGRPFWRSLGWKIPFLGTILITLFAGPVLAVTIGYLGYALRAPDIPLPFDQMLQDRPTLMLFAIFVVILGPLFEELAFRGFLMPLLMRSFGVAYGIVATGLLFGCLHGYEYAWSWRHILLISIAGTVFGLVRYRSGSTAASAFLHSTYNLAQFAAFVVQARTR